MPDRSTPDLRLTSTRPVLDDLVGTMSVEQQAGLLSGAGYWSTGGDTSIGLRPMTLSDGPAGVRGTTFDERDPSTCLPAPVLLGATWDEALVGRVSALLAVEARQKGVDVVLGPMVNLQRSPFGGRHFECLSEDPLLSGRIGAAFVRGVQGLGVGAAAKHYVANDSESSRTTVDVQVDDRTLREVYLAPFEQLVVDAGVWMVMAAYNTVNGRPMHEHPLLTAPLVDEWMFDGVVVSDWYGVRRDREEASVQAGIGLVMPGPDDTAREAVLRALRSGRLSVESLREPARRLITLGARVGALTDVPPRRPVEPDADDVAQLLREAAAAGIVLLSNSRALLPLDGASVRRLAVLGPGAAAGWICGGGSCGVAVRRATSPVAGLTAALGGQGSVDHAEGVSGVDRLTPMSDAVATCPECRDPGFSVRYRDASGRLIRTEHRRSGRLTWFGDDIVRGSTVELAATLRADAGGSWHIGVAAVGALTLVVDGEIAIDEIIEPRTAGFASSFLDPPERHIVRRLDRGQTVEVVLRLADLAPPESFAALTLGVRRPRLPPDEELGRAVDLARAADTCVVVVGTGPQVETEGRDRTTLALPGGQDDLVRAVAAVNPRTIVVVNAGAPVLLPWRDRVAAVVVAWFPGQEFGTALADVLFGAADPGGRLPCTWPDREDQTPVLSTRPVDGVLRYAEGLHVGHRAWLRDGEQPAYPFGHGLSYAEWTYVQLNAPASVRRGAAVTVRIRLRNTGARPGKDVVQVYLSRPGSDVERPVRWLAGFTVVRAAPGADVVAEVQVAARAFQHWSTPDGRWVNEPGAFELLAGRSVGDLLLAARIDVL